MKTYRWCVLCAMICAAEEEGVGIWTQSAGAGVDHWFVHLHNSSYDPPQLLVGGTYE